MQCSTQSWSITSRQAKHVELTPGLVHSWVDLNIVQHHTQLIYNLEYSSWVGLFGLVQASFSVIH